jgi:hypothetical protein
MTISVFITSPLGLGRDRHRRQNNVQNNDSADRANQQNGLLKSFGDLQRDRLPALGGDRCSTTVATERLK